MKKDLKIAIVADWLTNYGGAEKVVESFLHLFDDADLFTTVYVAENCKHIAKDRKIKTSYLQKLPKFLRKRHPLLLPFLPKAIESFDLTSYDLVLSSSIFVSKGVLTNPDTLHISYCHTPARFLWEEKDSYLKNFPIPAFMKFFMPKLFHKLRIWDKFSAERVDYYLANSNYTKEKIEKAWRKKSKVISPPVDIDFFKKGLNVEKERFYLYIGRLATQKNVELLIETFKKMPRRKLKIAGKGILEKKLKKMAQGYDNIEFLGYVKDQDLPTLFAKARAVLFPQVEDAGIVPLESMAAGTPVIAYQKGGVLDTLTEETGVFFKDQSLFGLKSAIDDFDRKSFDRDKLHNHALKFSKEKFEERIKEEVSKKIAKFSVI